MSATNKRLSGLIVKYVFISLVNRGTSKGDVVEYPATIPAETIGEISETEVDIPSIVTVKTLCS